MYISKDALGKVDTTFFDMDYNKLDLKFRCPMHEVAPEKPARFEEMVELSKALSRDIPTLRVDFYLSKGELYVGELTFSHVSGFFDIHPDSWDEIMGDWLQLPVH